MRPTWDDVRRAFERHLEHYLEQGGEPALIGLRAEGSVTLQYAGRVVLELLQNALDRAEPAGDGANVLVRLDGQTLVVANNGRPFAVDPTFDYAHPREGEERADFNALCALHTSNKAAERQFGNKGIGFRSVFGVGDRVQLWSRLNDGGWWGLELRTAFQPADWPTSALPELDQKVREKGTQRRPSFHLPIPLRSETSPAAELEAMETVVLLPVDHQGSFTQIEAEVMALERTHLRFVGLRKPGLTVRIRSTTVGTSSTSVVAVEHPELAKAALGAGHPVAAPKVAIAWTDDGTNGHFFNYLPTRMSTGLPVDIHGDFQVKADREGMALDDANRVGAFNRMLLREAAHLLVAQLMLSSSATELWRRAGLPKEGPPEWTVELQDALFPEDSWDTWLNLARAFFRTSRSRLEIEAFWESALGWMVKVVGSSPRSKSWKEAARELCDQLAEEELPLIPVRTAAGETAVPLPSRQQKGARAARRVFFTEGDESEMPRALLNAGRAVTDCDLRDWEHAAGVVRYDRLEVLDDLRQVPLNAAAFEPGDPLSADDQRELLAFASKLLDQGPPRQGFAWRAFTDQDPWARMGRSLATLFLPTRDGAWEPARQLSLDQVDTERWPGLLTERLCSWLGVAPAGAIPLVEHGAAVPAQHAPPALQAAGTTRVGDLEPRSGVHFDFDAVARTVAALPENARRNVCHRFGAIPCYPSALLRTHDRLPPLPAHVAPRNLVLTRRDARTVFLAVPIAADQDALLVELGASERLQGSPAADLLMLLRQRVPDPQQLDAQLQLRLTELVAALVGEVDVEGMGEVCVLIQAEDGVHWHESGEEAWLPRDEDRSIVRRFFPTVPLVVGTLRAGLAERLGVRELALDHEVHSSEPPEETAVARDVHARISSVLGPLCAMAELSGQWRQGDEDGADRETRIRTRWFHSGVLKQTSDVWMLLSLRGPTTPPVAWRKGEFEDVFELPDDGVIYFDTRREDGPPLPGFGWALAQILTNNRALGPTFVEVLAAAEADQQHDHDWRTGAGRVGDLLARRHGSELAADWHRKLQPLSDGQQAMLREVLGRFCQGVDDVLAHGVLRSRDLRAGLGLRTASELRDGIEAAIGDTELIAFAPRIIVARENREGWRRWMAKWSRKLAAWSEQELGKFARADFEARAEAHFDDLDFEPATAACAILGRPVENLEDALLAFTPQFKPVCSAPVSNRWASVAGGFGEGGTGPERRVTLAEIADAQVAREVYGAEAEAAFLPWVIETTSRCIASTGARELLLSVFRPDSETRKLVAEAIDAGDWRRALQVSELWSGAGFDLVGLEECNSELVVVRYECKGLPAGARRVRVHVSRNQLALARRVRRDGPGRWMLVGIEPDGRASDLTPRLEPLLDEHSRDLQTLLDRGIEPDGIRLVIEQVGESSEADAK